MRHQKELSQRCVLTNRARSARLSLEYSAWFPSFSELGLTPRGIHQPRWPWNNCTIPTRLSYFHRNRSLQMSTRRSTPFRESFSSLVSSVVFFLFVLDWDRRTVRLSPIFPFHLQSFPSWPVWIFSGALFFVCGSGDRHCLRKKICSDVPVLLPLL